MTSLQQINETLKEYIKIPLSTFYKIVLTFTVILFIAIIILTVPSFSKLGSTLLLFFLFITTSLLFYGNYHEENISEYFENIELESKNLENIQDEQNLELKQLKENTIENEINKDYIA